MTYRDFFCNREGLEKPRLTMLSVVSDNRFMSWTRALCVANSNLRDAAGVPSTPRPFPPP